jgi:methylmalonyl-CoA carboxyltransferase 12S subunit
MPRAPRAKDLADILEQFQAQLAALMERVERLEAAGATEPDANGNEPAIAAVEQTPPPPEPGKPVLTDEQLLAVSAALGAYMGVRVRIKQIRLLSSRAWAQQGRVSIQASHNLHN